MTDETTTNTAPAPTKPPKFDRIVGPADHYRGFASGISPEHGDSAKTVAEKINGFMEGVEAWIHGLHAKDQESSNASGNPSSNASSNGSAEVSVNEANPAQAQAAQNGTLSPASAPVASFGQQPGNIVGSTVDKNNDNNRFVISGATGQVVSEQPVVDQEQKPGAQPLPEEAAEEHVATPPERPEDVDHPTVVTGEQPGFTGQPDPQKERDIEASEQSPDPETIPANVDPKEAVDNPETPPSDGTLARADATASNNVRTAE